MSKSLNMKARVLSEQLTSLFNKDITVTPEEVKRAEELTENSAEATEIIEPLISQYLKQNNLKNSCYIKQGPCKRLIRMFSKKAGQNLPDISDVPDVGRVRLLVTNANDIETIRMSFFRR